jgi:iduronate 2-sulfatase
MKPVSEMLPQMALVLLTLAELSAVGEQSQSCLSGDRQPNVCFSTTPTLAATQLSANASSADACCSACLQAPQCYCWTYDTRNEDSHDPEAADRCELKHLLVDGSTSSPTCVSGNVKSPLPIAPPPVPPALPPPRGAHSVLFLVVDDLRPQLGTYSAPFPKTPHIDRLAATGLRFDRAYVQWPVCAPSRNSFMSGRRPDTTRVFEFLDHFREVGVGHDWLSLPGYFKRHGFLVLGGGKLFHPEVPPNNDWPTSWSPDHAYFPQNPPQGPYSCVELGPSSPIPGQCAGHRTAHASTGCTWCAANVSKEASTLADQAIRDNAIAQLRAAAAVATVPFFIGAGFHRPHVPWVVPHEFFDALPPWQEIPLAADVYAPVGMPDAAWHYPADVTEMVIDFNGTCNATRSRLYRRAYYAACAYQDYNIGMVLEELEELKQAEDTLVVMLGDHGWNLGEHDLW